MVRKDIVRTVLCWMGKENKISNERLKGKENKVNNRESVVENHSK